MATYYVSPYGNNGSGNGSIGSPWLTLNYAWSYVSAGDIIYMRGGTYNYGATGTTLSGKNGSAGNLINIWAYPGEYPVIDYMGTARSSQLIGISISSASYLYLKGIRVTRISQAWNGSNYVNQYGLRINSDVSNCKFELLETDHIGGWGVSNWGGSGVHDLLYLNCDSHHNADPGSGDNYAYGGADGFQNEGSATGITFRGCRSWRNSDDGWDIRTCDGIFTLENCWSFWNGYREDGVTEGGDGEGLKLGNSIVGNRSDTRRFVKNCLIFENRWTGTESAQDENGYVGIEVYNTVVYGNGEGINFNYAGPTLIRNSVSYNNGDSDRIGGGGGTCTHDHNNFDISINVTNSSFLSVNSAGVDGPRQSDGSLPVLNFLKPSSGSNLRGVGAYVASNLTDGAGNNYLTPRSIGAYEYLSGGVVVPTLTTTSVTSITTTTATSGGNISSDGGGTVTARGICWSTSANPTTANSQTQDGAGTGVFVSGLYNLTVGTVYHVRAYATNSAGTAYGSDVSFTTSGGGGGSTHYIATNGNNGNSGSIGSPWATLYYATTQVTFPGDLIYANAGTYTEPNRCSLAVGVSLQGAGKGVTIIKGTYFGAARGVDYSYDNYTSDYQHCTLFLNSSSQGTNGNQTISNLTLDGDNLTGTAAIIVRQRGHVIIHDCVIKDFFTGGIALHASSNIFSEPTYKAEDNEIYNTDFINCSNLAGWNSLTCTEFTGQKGLRMHDNTYDLTHRAAGKNGDYFTGAYYSEDVKIYNSTFTRLENEGNWWSIGSEFFDTSGGFEIYNNRYYGGEIAFDVASNPDGQNGHYKNSYGYTFYIHDNYFESTPTEPSSNNCLGGILFEDSNFNDVIVTRNYFKNCVQPFEINSTNSNENSDCSNIEFSYNILEHCGYQHDGVDWNHSYVIKLRNGYNDSGIHHIFNNVDIVNNVIIADQIADNAGIQIWSRGEMNNINVKNNIIRNMTSEAPVIVVNDGVINGLHIDNNIFYGNTNSNNVLKSGNTVSNYTFNNTIKSDPLFVSTTDFHLQAGSPGIDAGVDVGLTLDYASTAVTAPIDIGVYVYGGGGGIVSIPTLTTTAITSITVTTAISGGNIASDGGGIVTVRGVVWDTSANPTIALSTKTSNGTGTGVFSSSITGLSGNTIYHVRAYATNSAGTAYGGDVSFESAHIIPTITTAAMINITSSTASSGGNVLLQGGEDVTAKGVCWGTSANPTTSNSYTTDGTGLGAFTSSITGLSAGTTYHIRAYATNSIGTAYGADVQFITTGLTKSLSDTLTLSDTSIRETHFALNISENSLVLTDSIVKQVVYNRIIADNITSSDINIKDVATNRADSLTLADSNSYVLSIIGGKALADALSLSDNITAKEISKVLSDNLVLVDTMYPVDSAFPSIVINELLTLSDEVTGKDIEKVLSDNIVLTDGESKLIAIYPEDGYTITDTALVSNLILKALADSVTFSDVILSITKSIPIPVPPRHRCAFLDWIRKGIASFHYTDAPVVSTTLVGPSPVHLPSPQQSSDNSLLSRINVEEDQVGDLGEHRR